MSNSRVLVTKLQNLLSNTDNNTVRKEHIEFTKSNTFKQNRVFDKLPNQFLFSPPEKEKELKEELNAILKEISDTQTSILRSISDTPDQSLPPLNNHLDLEKNYPDIYRKIIEWRNKFIDLSINELFDEQGNIKAELPDLLFPDDPGKQKILHPQGLCSALAMQQIQSLTVDITHNDIFGLFVVLLINPTGDPRFRETIAEKLFDKKIIREEDSIYERESKKIKYHPGNTKVTLTNPSITINNAENEPVSSATVIVVTNEEKKSFFSRLISSIVNYFREKMSSKKVDLPNISNNTNINDSDSSTKFLAKKMAIHDTPVKTKTLLASKKPVGEELVVLAEDVAKSANIINAEKAKAEIVSSSSAKKVDTKETKENTYLAKFNRNKP